MARSLVRVGVEGKLVKRLRNWAPKVHFEFSFLCQFSSHGFSFYNEIGSSIIQLRMRVGRRCRGQRREEGTKQCESEWIKEMEYDSVQHKARVFKVGPVSMVHVQLWEAGMQ